MNLNDALLIIQGKNRKGTEVIYNGLTGEGIILGYQSSIVAHCGEGYDPRSLLDNRREYVVLRDNFEQLRNAAEKLSALTEINLNDDDDNAYIFLPETPQVQQAKDRFAKIYQLYFS